MSSAETEGLQPHQIAELQAARGRATASMVLGIIGIVLFGLLALIAAPLGHSARNTFKKYPLHASNYGSIKANTGITLAWIVIGAWVIIWIIIIGAISAAS